MKTCGCIMFDEGFEKENYCDYEICRKKETTFIIVKVLWRKKEGSINSRDIKRVRWWIKLSDRRLHCTFSTTKSNTIYPDGGEKPIPIVSEWRLESRNSLLKT